MRTQKEFANAKINLYLDVVARRDDGFHDIKSVMHSVSLCDDIVVKYTPSSITSIKIFVSGCKYLPCDARNLAYKAALLFLERAKLTASLEIKIEKRIPVAAGLAGGSADAAAVLRAMNKIFGRLFAERALMSMAAELGSDVPFCLQKKTALCEGRGEVMTKLDADVFCHFVIATPNEFVSTPQAYKKLDEIYSDFDGTKPTGGENSFLEFSKELMSGNLCGKTLFNIFERAVFPMCPGAEMIKNKLVELGAHALMSGSGPSVFGIFPDKETAISAAKKLSEENINVVYAHSF